MPRSVLYDPAGNLLGYRRTPYAIYNDLNALSAAQKNAVWADLTSVSPPKYLAEDGDDQGAIAALHWATSFSGATGAALLAARLLLAALYLRISPQYLDGVVIGGQNFAVKGYDPVQ